MKLTTYLKDKAVIIFTYLLMSTLIISLTSIFNLNHYCIYLICFLLLINLIIIILIDFIPRYFYYKELDRLLSTLDKEYLVTSLIDQPAFLDGKLLYNYLYSTNKSMIEHINTYKYSSEEFKEYIELWCHEIKTPVATSKLLITNNKNDITMSINDELNRIDNYIEQILFYSRSNIVDKDYIINKTNLKDIINNIIKRNKKDLITKKIKVTINVNNNVYSDSKWLEFIINQIITNSIKYEAKNITISDITNKNNTILNIKDDGIGIKESEVNKVFDKGFTGSNGRKKYNSTGIGLYLCKKLCKKLGHEINVSSHENEYTTVSIIFPQSSIIDNVTK